LPVKPFKVPAMRLPRVRITVRRTMLLVSASALVFAATTYQQKALWCRERARSHSRRSLVYDIASKGQDAILVGDPIDGVTGGYFMQTPNAAETEADKATMHRIAQYHADLSSKYERAASRPWLPLDPDPPEPQ
jgi:hypothetical protein